MSIDKKLLELDFLVFSSHKTATQTLVSTLNCSGLRARHCHVLSNIGIERGELPQYISEFTLENRRKLQIITVFRDPMERHISSFFQWYGSKPLVRGEVQSETDTIIYRKSIPELQKQFITEVNSGTLVGLQESLEHICEELKIANCELTYNESAQYGSYNHEHCDLYLLRFDELVRNLANILSRVSGRPVSTIDKRNMSHNKWYSSLYREFRDSLCMPADIVKVIYESRAWLFQIFYPDKFEYMLDAALAKYSRVPRDS